MTYNPGPDDALYLLNSALASKRKATTAPDDPTKIRLLPVSKTKATTPSKKSVPPKA